MFQTVSVTLHVTHIKYMDTLWVSTSLAFTVCLPNSVPSAAVLQVALLSSPSSLFIWHSLHKRGNTGTVTLVIEQNTSVTWPDSSLCFRLAHDFNSANDNLGGFYTV